METLKAFWEIFGSLYSLVAGIYFAAHILLPTQMIHPLKVTISCKENGCRWEAKGWDRGGVFTRRLLVRLKSKHKRHFIVEHPDVEWIYE